MKSPSFNIGSRPASRKQPDQHQRPARHPLGVLLGAGAGDAAGLVRRGQRSGRLCGRTRRRRPRPPARAVPQFGVFQVALSNMEQVLAKSDLQIAAGYAALVSDQSLAKHIFGLIEAEWRRTRDAFTPDHRGRPAGRQPSLARSLANRLPFMDALNILQIELIRRLRQTPDAADLLYTAHQTINGIAAGLRNSGQSAAHKTLLALLRCLYCLRPHARPEDRCTGFCERRKRPKAATYCRGFWALTRFRAGVLGHRQVCSPSSPRCRLACL